MKTTMKRLLLVVVASAYMHAPAEAQTFARMEIHPIASVTVTSQQFLTGDRYGRPVILSGELRLPPATGKVPAVILMHGSGGLSASTDRWAQELNSISIAAFILDSFTGRGIVNTNADQSQLESIAMMYDAYAALARLASHPRIDATRIGIMGFSKGAVAAVYSSNQRFRQLYGPVNAEFAAHIGCPRRATSLIATTSKSPASRYASFMASRTTSSIQPCRAYVGRLREARANVLLTEYPDAHHAYDNFTLPGSQRNATAKTTRNCVLEESDKGAVLNAKTRQAYNLANDPCVELGPHVGYNKTAHEATVHSVKEFLSTTFKVQP